MPPLTPSISVIEPAVNTWSSAAVPIMAAIEAGEFLFMTAVVAADSINSAAPKVSV